MIYLYKRGRRIEIQSAEPLPGMRTTIPGAYQSASGNWTVPLSVESYILLRQKYGKRLRLNTELQRWISNVRQNRKYMAGLAAARDTKLRVLPKQAPKLYRAMNKRKYQRVGARFIAESHAALVADDPGLGKTLIAMGGIIEAEVPGPYLIVAPKTAAESVWRREIQRWLPAGHKAVTLPDTRKQRERRMRLTRYGPRTWLIVHPEIVLVQAWVICAKCKKRNPAGKKQATKLACGHLKKRRDRRLVIASYPNLFEIKWGAVIVDESHESLIRRKGEITQRRRGLELLGWECLRAGGIRIAMSGTPFDSKPHQLWGTLNWLEPEKYSAFYRWAELFWTRGGYTGFEIGEFRKDREKMLWSSLSAISIRRTKAEVAPDLPPKMEVGSNLDPADPDSPIGIWLPMDPKQETAYRQMEETSIAELDSGRLEAVTALSELTRLKQLACCYGDIHEKMIKVSCHRKARQNPQKNIVICSDCQSRGWHPERAQFFIPGLPSNKFQWIIESLEEWGYPKNPLTKVVIVSFYTGILNAFARGIEKHFRRKPGRELCTAITGRVPSRDRRDVIDRFNREGSDTPQIMMLNVKAGGTAITIDSADRMIFISETRSPDQQKQAEDRIHRVSNPRQCMYYYLRSLDTVDIGTALMNGQAIRDTHRLLDKRRGVDYVRHVLNLSHGLS